MGHDVQFGCNCGNVQGIISDVTAKSGLHALCHCSQCRTAELYLDQLDPIGSGVGVYQTAGDKVQFTSGRDQLAAFSFAPARLVRWHATCCNAPLFNTMASRRMGFASLIAARASDPTQLGPIKAEGFLPAPNGKQLHKGLHRIIGGMLMRTIRITLSGKWRLSPFYDEDGQTIVPVANVTADQTAHLLAKT